MAARKKSSKVSVKRAPKHSNNELAIFVVIVGAVALVIYMLINNMFMSSVDTLIEVPQASTGTEYQLSPQVGQ